MELSPGVTAFLGPNGSGKSNAVKAIPFALVGAVEDGTKADHVAQLTGNLAYSMVEVEFLHGDCRAVVRRYLKGGQTSLSLFDASGVEIESVKGDTKTTERILALLGTTQQILSDYVFVGQEELFAPFSAKTRPADRAVAFQKLFGLGRAEECWAVIGTRLSATPEVVPPDIESIERERDTLQAQLVVEAAKVAMWEPLRNWVEADDPSTAVLERARKAKGAETAAPSVKADKENGDRRVADLKKSIDGYRDQVTVFESAIAAALPSEAAAEATVTQRTNFVNRAWRRKPLEEAITRAEKSLETLGAPPVLQVTWPGPAEVTNVHAEIEKDVVKLSVAEQLLKTFDAGAPECPTCHRVVDMALVELVERARLDKPRLEAQIESYRKYAAAVNTHQLRDEAYTSGKKRGMQELLAAHEALTKFDLTDPPVLDVAEAEWQAASTLQKNLQAWRTSLAAAKAPLVSLGPAYDAAVAAQSRLDLAVVENEMTRLDKPCEEEQAAAKARLEQTRNAKTQLAVAEATAARVNSDIAAVQLRLVGAKALADHSKKTRAIREKLNSIRTVLHRDNLPSLAAKRYLDALAYDTNEILSMFNAGFRLQSEDGLSYRANFFDGRNQPLVRLSGGQKVITALAFRIAINARFAKDLGMLCLDEPTAYLDADNIGCLDLALSKLHQLSQSRSLQCILITHEAVGHLVDHVESFTTQ